MMNINKFNYFVICHNFQKNFLEKKNYRKQSRKIRYCDFSAKFSIQLNIQ